LCDALLGMRILYAERHNLALAATAAVLLGLLFASIIFGAAAIPIVLLGIIGALVWIGQSAPEHEEDDDHLLH